MTKDDRLYAKLDVNFATHYKIACLTPEAFRTLVEMILWSRVHMTDGIIPQQMIFDDMDGQETPTSKQRSNAWFASVCFDLLHNDDENPSLKRGENGAYIIHDFAKHQTTSFDLASLNDARKRAGQKGGIASGRSRREANRSKREASASSPTRSKRSKTKPETETETEINKDTDVSLLGRARPRGTRLPANWEPASEVVARMRSDHPHVNLQAETAKFLDYWHAKTGANATKLDWDATWRNWVRTASEQKPAQTRNGRPISRTDEKIAGWQAITNQLVAEMTPTSAKELPQ